jgi:hypothetical protein
MSTPLIFGPALSGFLPSRQPEHPNGLAETWRGSPDNLKITRHFHADRRQASGVRRQRNALGSWFEHFAKALGAGKPAALLAGKSVTDQAQS